MPYTLLWDVLHKEMIGTPNEYKVCSFTYRVVKIIVHWLNGNPLLHKNERSEKARGIYHISVHAAVQKKQQGYLQSTISYRCHTIGAKRIHTLGRSWQLLFGQSFPLFDIGWLFIGWVWCCSWLESGPATTGKRSADGSWQLMSPLAEKDCRGASCMMWCILG